MEIKDLRKTIDEVDEQLIALFRKRFETAEEIALVKAKEGKALVDPEREKVILEKAAAALGSEDGILLYKSILNISHRRQKQALSETEEGKEK